MTSGAEEEALARSIGTALPCGLLAGVVVGTLVGDVGLGIGVGLPLSTAVAGVLHARRQSRRPDAPGPAGTASGASG
ncbi:hypothetical protein [Blastococcus sp. PRF04-17]|uniref:hypothetical protein n=1 Tax=Blastococcus sp. PRF04-17 TaxID=2933797 RepID=UPI001FF3084E|nr:hypothetical protein [Blastococcus sp. PRF04-17]UOY02714.1 hypothetical protein MVA48_04940 [Blastococcus sp. PRF04-17]